MEIMVLFYDLLTWTAFFLAGMVIGMKVGSRQERGK
jgi:hypothetical protein